MSVDRSLFLFRNRLDGELLSYAAKKLSEIRPEASLNREAGTTEAANADASPAASASSSPSGAEPRAEILDPCCGGRMWWWEKDHPLAIYVDRRERVAGTIPQKPLWKVAPDIVADFRTLPFDDESFRLVVFDPPHQTQSRAGTGINAEQYGSWDDASERDEALRLGFAECWRVLARGGTLVFKWAGKVADVQAAFPVAPVVGTRPRGRKTGPSWVIFYKPFAAEFVTRDAA